MNYRDKIRKAIECPQFGYDHYGEWGALRIDQRKYIKRLLDELDSADAYILKLYEENQQLKEQLEEDKDIELLDVALLSQSDNWLWCPSKEDFEKDIELNSYIISNIRENTLNFQRKLNEVIKEVNKLRKKK